MGTAARINHKTCNRCGRTGSHAFRRTSDGLHECTTTTACRARARRLSGNRTYGRGRLPKQRPLTGGAPGVAYVIGPDGAARSAMERSLREATGFTVAVGEASRTTLTALGSRNVKLIAIDADCLAPIGFRNEFSLRRRQPKMRAVPIVLFGRQPASQPALQDLAAGEEPEDAAMDDVLRKLRRRMRAIESGGPAEP